MIYVYMIYSRTELFSRPRVDETSDGDIKVWMLVETMTL